MAAIIFHGNNVSHYSICKWSRCQEKHMHACRNVPLLDLALNIQTWLLWCISNTWWRQELAFKWKPSQYIIVYSPWVWLLHVCVCVPLGNLRIPAQPRRSAGPQGRAVCKCVRGAHMSACTCTCLCLYSNISTLQWGWFYPTCHHTRQEIKPEGVCLPWKSLNRLLQWNPGVHPARTCSTPMNNILWKW